MRRLIIAMLVGALVFGAIAPSTRPVHASPLPARLASAAELIQLVNQLRAANGLAPYRANSALMAAAQAHSEYQAATENTSHTGKGGSRPRDRAVAYGYGGGAAVYVSENIATGTNLSAGEAVGWWQGDNIHLTTMLSPNYRDAGAGAAEANGVVYYTLDVGYVAGDEGQPPASQPPHGNRQPGGTPGSNPAPAGTPIAWIVPIQAATPRADGSIEHEVQWGQFLLDIAAAYKIELPYLLTLNDLNADTVIFPGDKLLIRPPRPTPTLESSPTAEPGATTAPSGNPTSPQEKQILAGADHAQSITPTPKKALSTATPAALAKAPAQQSAVENLDPEVDMNASVPAQDSVDSVLVFIGVLIVLGTGLLLFGSAIGRRS